MTEPDPSRSADVLSVPGQPGGPNEDYAGFTERGVAVVLDGVTPPADGDNGCCHGVAWFTGNLGRVLLQTAGARRGADISTCLADAVAATAAAHGPACDLSHPKTPQATVAMLRWDRHELEYLVLSDAAVLIETGDGRVRTVLDDRLDTMGDRPDLRALRQKAEAAAAGSPAREAAVQAHLAARQALRNKEGGFFTAAADPDVSRHAVIGAMPRDQVSAAAALTDGATRWTQLFGMGDWAALFGVLRQSGARDLVKQVRAAEAADHDCVEFRRTKTHDDASIVFVEL